jgi:ubiquitin carboxyl-terminal hydrolase 14
MTSGLWKGLLKDNFDLTTIDFPNLKPPIQILLMGSSSELSGPKVKTIFVEDLPEEEIAKVAPEPSGLTNLGNTCYLNSVLQALRIIPEFRSVLTNPPRPSASNSLSQTAMRNTQSNRVFLLALANTFTELDRTSKPVSPSTFLAATFKLFPQFAQAGSHGQRMQQDAEEFYSGLLNAVAQETEGVPTIQAAFSKCNKTVDEKDLNGATNLIDAVFGIKMEETLTCDEFAASSLCSSGMDADSAPVEPSVTRFDLHRKLVCNIQGGSDSSSQTNITHIMEGIHLSLNGTFNTLFHYYLQHTIAPCLMVNTM